MSNFLCKRGWHRFKPRYKVEAAPWVKLVGTFKGATPSVLDIKQHKYDICTRCGVIVKGD